MPICRYPDWVTIGALWLTLIAAAALNASAAVFRDVFVDTSGQLHVTLSDGKEIVPRAMKGQVAFSAPAISPDQQTVGWLVEYRDTAAKFQADPLAGVLVLYRDGHIIHSFHTNQVFWDWHFQDDGKRVAYSTGPMHGGAAECILAGSVTGKVIARWWVKPGQTPPAWAASLRR